MTKPVLFNYMHQLEKHMIPAKDILKWIMAPYVTKGLNLKVNMDGTFFLCIIVNYPPEAPIVMSLLIVFSVQRYSKTSNDKESLA